MRWPRLFTDVTAWYLYWFSKTTKHIQIFCKCPSNYGEIGEQQINGWTLLSDAHLFILAFADFYLTQYFVSNMYKHDHFK